MRKLILPVLATLALATPALAVPITYGAVLLGANEVPAVNTPGFGSALVTIDLEAHTLTVSATFQGLIGNTTAAHVHCCQPLGTNAGVATQTPSFTGFPLGVMSGIMPLTVFDTLAASTWNLSNAMLGGTAASAEIVFANALASGLTYFNIHTTFAGGGEIRGQLAPVPEPATLALVGLGLSGFAAMRRRSKRS
jgi:hypothetical protein